MSPGPFARMRARRAVPLEAFSRTEKVIAFCRILLALATGALVLVDPAQPSFRPELAYATLLSYVAFSVVTFLLVRGEYVHQENVGPVSTALDIVWITAISLFTEGGASPFFLLNVFVILAVSVRWGFAVSAPVTLLLALLYPGIIFAANRLIDAQEFPFHRVHLFRPVYLLALGYLVGYLGDHERRSKRKMAFMLGLTQPYRSGRAPGRAFTRLMRRTLQFFAADRAVLALRDPDTGRYFTWDMRRRDGRLGLALRITGTAPFSVPFAAVTEAFLANDLTPDGRSALCYDVGTGSLERRTVPAGVDLPGDGAASSVMMAPVLLQGELRGRAYILRETGQRKFTRDDLEFLILLVGQAAAGLEAKRLQEKAEEVAVLEERGRIARDLHDGFIQSLAGIDLRIEACKMLLQRDPARVPRELEDLHEAVERGYREVRQYLKVLRTASWEVPEELGSTLDRLAEEFSIREGIAVHVARPPTDPALPKATAFELTQIVREALRNAVRHGAATQAVVKLGSRDNHLWLVVRDNGRGFRVDPSTTHDGFLSPAAQPWSIRERTAALGGALRVWSQPQRGAEVSVTIPMVPAAQNGERRRHA